MIKKVASVKVASSKIRRYLHANGAVEVTPGRFGFPGMNRNTLDRVWSELKCSQIVCVGTDECGRWEFAPSCKPPQSTTLENWIKA